MRTIFLFQFLLLLFCITQATAKDNLLLLDAQGRILFQIESKSFGIRFRHSVALSFVEEWFTIKQGQLVLEKTIYEDFGAGLPFQPEQNQIMQFKDKKIILSNYNSAFKSFEQRVGRIAEHTLLLPGQPSIPLSRFVEPGGAITFKVQTITP